MQEPWITSALTHTIATYLVQAVLGTILCLIFRYFALLYKRAFLKTWAASWLAFTFFMLGDCLTFAGLTHGHIELRLIFTAVGMLASLCQVVFVLIGSLELTRNRKLNKNHFLIIIASLTLLSILLVLYKNDEPSAANIRYVIRVGLKYAILGIGFLAAAIITFQSPRFKKGIGQKILVGGYLLYATVDFYYVIVVAVNVWGGSFQFPAFFGLIEMLSICLIGLGMVMWLLQDERDELRKTNKQLDSFLYSVSHDLRSPIASVLGLTNLAKMELQEEKGKEYIAMIDERVKKLDLVIGDILQLSKSSKLSLNIQSVNFNQLLEGIIADVKFNQGATAITLRYEASPNNILYTDYEQLKMVLANLISNAVKYHNINQPDPYLEIIFMKNKNKVTITVADNGEGIAKENLERIFDMFYRASRSADGTGLGLYIVKESLNRMNGTIAVNSVYGKGSVFTVTLPSQ